MTDDQIKDPPGLSNDAEGAAPPAPDHRDAIIERLERAVAGEREHAATLRKTAEELRFRVGILEKSYAKQLEDARLRSETAERELADQRDRMAALETAHEDAVRLLAEARTDLERIRADRGQLPKAFPPTHGVQINTTAQDDAESRGEEGSQTINRLMMGSSWADEGQPVGPEKEHPEAQARSDQDLPAEELVAPELVFAAKRDHDP
jgi:chromosome segregation ATPase